MAQPATRAPFPVIMAGLTAALAILTGMPAGYALARHAFHGREPYRVTVITTRAFPVVVLSIPLAVFFLRWGVYDSVWAVAFMHTALTLPFVVLISASVLAEIPADLEEAAQVLGCGRLGAVARVVVPPALPGLASAAGFAVLMSCSEVFAASALAAGRPTLPALGASALTSSPEPYKYAAAWLLMAPMFAFIFLIRRHVPGAGWPAEAERGLAYGRAGRRAPVGRDRR
jgi:multiple sugar transport system permease protein